MIPYGRQLIDEDDIKAVLEVLRSDWITQGPKVAEFEKALAEYCGARFAVAVSSGTAALHIACLASSIESGEEVITSPITFAATANSVEFCGGKPVFADIYGKTHNICTEAMAKKITTRTRALMPVHLAGLPCDMESISEIAKTHKLMVIEDACHALGATYKSQGSGIRGQEDKNRRSNWIKVGSCKHSDMTVFSFHPVKHITTGEGGAVLTNNPSLYERLLMFRNHGITKDASRFTSHLSQHPESWYYEMQMLGFNYRITDIQCVLGLSQLKKIDFFVRRRCEIADAYNDAFRDIEFVEIPLEPDKTRSSYHLYQLRIDFEKLGKTRSEVTDNLRRKGIGTQVHYIPVHLHPYYRDKYGYKKGDYPEAEKYYEQTLSIPLYPAMTASDVEQVISAVRECFEIK